MLSVPWYFAQQNDSSHFNFIYAIITFATLFWGLVGGTIVDRFNRKHVFLVNNAVEGCVILSIALYGMSAGEVPVPLIILGFTTTIFGFYLHYPNLYAFAHEITAEGDYTKVTSAIEVVGQTTNVLAGAFAAFLLAGIDWQATWQLAGHTWAIDWQVKPWPLHRIFLMDGITYFISIALIAYIRYTPKNEETIDRRAFVQRLRLGFSYLREHPAIFLFGVFSHVIFVVMLVNLHALMPMYITNHLKAGGNVFGAMEVLYAVGAVSAGLFVGNLFRKLTAVRSVIIMLLMAAGALVLSATTRSVGIFLCVGLLIGFSNAGARVLRLSYMFRHVPNQVIGRVNSIFSIINVMNRALFILLFSLPFFEIGSNIIWGYAILAIFVSLSAAVLTWRYQSIVAAGT